MPRMTGPPCCNDACVQTPVASSHIGDCSVSDRGSDGRPSRTRNLAPRPGRPRRREEASLTESLCN